MDVMNEPIESDMEPWNNVDARRTTPPELNPTKLDKVASLDAPKLSLLEPHVAPPPKVEPTLNTKVDAKVDAKVNAPTLLQTGGGGSEVVAKYGGEIPGDRATGHAPVGCPPPSTTKPTPRHSSTSGSEIRKYGASISGTAYNVPIKQSKLCDIHNFMGILETLFQKNATLT